MVPRAVGKKRVSLIHKCQPVAPVSRRLAALADTIRTYTVASVHGQQEICHLEDGPMCEEVEGSVFWVGRGSPSGADRNGTPTHRLAKRPWLQRCLLSLFRVVDGCLARLGRGDLCGSPVSIAAQRHQQPGSVQHVRLGRGDVPPLGSSPSPPSSAGKPSVQISSPHVAATNGAPDEAFGQMDKFLGAQASWMAAIGGLALNALRHSREQGGVLSGAG